MLRDRPTWAFIFWASYSIICVDCGLWSYQNEDGSSILTTRSSIQLEYFGDASQFSQWNVDSSSCSFNSSSSSSTVAECILPSTPTFSISTTDAPSEEKFPKLVTIKQTTDCYQWYLVWDSSQNVTEVSDENSGEYSQHKLDSVMSQSPYTEEMLHIWVVDMKYASPAEKQHLADQPSQFSQALTRQFHSLALSPVVHFKEHSLYTGYDSVGLPVFSEGEGYWEVNLYTRNPNQLRLLLSSTSSAAVCDCQIRDTEVSLKREVIANPASGVQVAVVSTLSPPIISQDACCGHVAVWMSSAGVVLTQDGFLSSEPRQMALPVGETDTGNYEVTSAVFTLQYLILLIGDKLYAVEKNTGTNTVLDLPVGVSTVQDIQGRDMCVQGFTEQTENNQWLLSTPASEFYLAELGHTGAVVSYTSVELTADTLSDLGYDGATVDIEGVTFSTFPLHLGIVAKVTHNLVEKVSVLHWNVITNRWTEVGCDLYSSGPYNLHPVWSAQPSYVVWNDAELTLAAINGSCSLQPFNISDGSQFLQAGESIQQVLSNKQGEVVVLLSSNRLYYGRHSVVSLIELDVSFPASSAPVLMFDLTGQLYSVVVSGDTVEKKVIPVVNELRNSLMAIGAPSCPYRELQWKKADRLLFLDIGDTVSLWAALTYPLTDTSLNLQVTTYPNDLLLVSESSESLYSNLYVMENKTINLTQVSVSNDSVVVTSYADLVANGSGVAGLEVKASQETMSCDLPTTLTSQVHVGCNLLRHVRVLRTEENCAGDFENFTYIISREKRTENGSTPSADLTVAYNYQSLGCPVKLHNTELLLPQLQLYDGTEFIRTLNASFVVWEEYDKTDFTYTATQHQAGCKRAGQTWDSMISAAGAGTAMRDVWGPENYESCFQEDLGSTSSSWRGEPYVILNGSSTNQLTFARDIDSLYILNVKVIDPTVSFCSLDTQFSVWVYGAVGKPDQMPKVLTLVTFGTASLIVLFISYWRFKDDSFLKADL